MRAMLALFLIASGLLVGCSSGDSAKGSTEGGQTPEDVFTAFKNAMAAEDWEALLSTVAPEDRGLKLLRMAIGATSITRISSIELKALLKKYGAAEFPVDRWRTSESARDAASVQAQSS